MLKDLGLGWMFFLALFVMVALMFTFATPNSVASARQVEDASILWLLGNTWASRADGFANRHFRAHFIDTGVVPTPRAPVDFSREAVGELREPPMPITVVQSGGPSYRVQLPID